MIRHTLAAVLLLLVSAAATVAQPVVILVRHAERADAGQAAAGTTSSDPDLSPAGHARAEALARLLKDATITAIYTTELKRTRQTAAPLARVTGLKPSIVPAAQSADLVRAITQATGVVLVVGHSNTVPELIARLGCKEPVTIGDEEFDNLFVLVRGAPPTLLRLRY